MFLKLGVTRTVKLVYGLFLSFVTRISWQPNILTTSRIASAQPAFTCSRLLIETIEQGVKYVQS